MACLWHSCTASSHSQYTRRHALRNELGKELPQNYNREEGHCEGEEGPEEAEYKEAPMADPTPPQDWQNGEAQSHVRAY